MDKHLDGNLFLYKMLTPRTKFSLFSILVNHVLTHTFFDLSISLQCGLGHIRKLAISKYLLCIPTVGQAKGFMKKERYQTTQVNPYGHIVGGAAIDFILSPALKLESYSSPRILSLMANNFSGNYGM